MVVTLPVPLPPTAVWRPLVAAAVATAAAAAAAASRPPTPAPPSVERGPHPRVPIPLPAVAGPVARGAAPAAPPTPSSPGASPPAAPCPARKTPRERGVAAAAAAAAPGAAKGAVVAPSPPPPASPPPRSQAADLAVTLRSLRLVDVPPPDRQALAGAHPFVCAAMKAWLAPMGNRPLLEGDLRTLFDHAFALYNGAVKEAGKRQPLRRGGARANIGNGRGGGRRSGRRLGAPTVPGGGLL